MKNLLRIALLILTLLALTGCMPISMPEEGLVIGQSYRLESGDVLNNDLTVIGGSAELEEDSTVNGDVAVLGGNLTIDGKVNGDVTVMGGYVHLDDHASIMGSVNSLGGTVQRSEQARVEGQEVQNDNRPPSVTTMRTPNMQVSFDPITAPLMAIFQALALAALAVLANLFLAPHMQRTGQAVTAQPFASGGVGCLTILVLVIMAITIILIPISLLGFIAAGIGALFGWLALGLVVGRQLAVWLKQPWTDPISAGVGTLTISLLGSLLNIIPCLGWLISFIAGLVALGAVVLTRFGTQIYPAPGIISTAPRPYPQPSAPPEPGAQVYDAPAANDTPRSDTPSNEI